MKKRIIGIVGHATTVGFIAKYAQEHHPNIEVIQATNKLWNGTEQTTQEYIDILSKDLNATVIYEKEPSKYINKPKNNYKKR